MASITSSQGTFGKKVEGNTRDLTEWMILLLNEVRRLRLGDTSDGEGNVL